MSYRIPFTPRSTHTSIKRLKWTPFQVIRNLTDNLFKNKWTKKDEKKKRNEVCVWARQKGRGAIERTCNLIRSVICRYGRKWERRGQQQKLIIEFIQFADYRYCCNQRIAQFLHFNEVSRYEMKEQASDGINCRSHSACRAGAKCIEFIDALSLIGRPVTAAAAVASSRPPLRRCRFFCIWFARISFHAPIGSTLWAHMRHISKQFTLVSESYLLSISWRSPLVVAALSLV